MSSNCDPRYNSRQKRDNEKNSSNKPPKNDNGRSSGIPISNRSNHNKKTSNSHNNDACNSKPENSSNKNPKNDIKNGRNNKTHNDNGNDHNSDVSDIHENESATNKLDNDTTNYSTKSSKDSSKSNSSKNTKNDTKNGRNYKTHNDNGNDHNSDVSAIPENESATNKSSNGATNSSIKSNNNDSNDNNDFNNGIISDHDNASNQNDNQNSYPNNYGHHRGHNHSNNNYHQRHGNYGHENSKPVMVHGIPMYEDKKKRANETLSIIQDGSYTLNGTTINIKQQIDQCVKSTKVYQSQEEIDIRNIPSNPTLCKFEITVESTLESASRILEMGISDVAVLNFASATKPGGGWINGREAQEESITRQSALYLSINSKEPNKSFYQVHEKLLKSDDPEKNLYTNTIIYSPKVPVIRDSQMEELLPQPIYVSFITSPATNLKLLIEDFQKAPKGSKLPNIYKEDSKKPKFDQPQSFNQRPGNAKKGNFGQPKNAYKFSSHPSTNYSQAQANSAVKQLYNSMQKSGHGQGHAPSNPQYAPSLPSIKNDSNNAQKSYADPRYQRLQGNKTSNLPNTAISQIQQSSTLKDNTQQKNDTKPADSQNQPSNIPKTNTQQKIDTKSDGPQNQPSDYQKSGKSDKVDDISSLKEKNRQVMRTRCEKIIKVCIANKNKAIVLGAFGCGIFGNDPSEVADIFYDILVTQKLGNYLDLVVFALKGAKTSGYTFTSFKNKFL